MGTGRVEAGLLNPSSSSSSSSSFLVLAGIPGSVHKGQLAGKVWGTRGPPQHRQHLLLPQRYMMFGDVGWGELDPGLAQVASSNSMHLFFTL